MKFITINHKVDLQSIKQNVVFHDSTSLSIWVYSGIMLFSLSPLSHQFIQQRNHCITSHIHTHTHFWLQQFQLLKMRSVCCQFKYCSVTVISLMRFLRSSLHLLTCRAHLYENAAGIEHGKWPQCKVWVICMSVCSLVHPHECRFPDMVMGFLIKMFIIPWLWQQALSKWSASCPALQVVTH